MRTRLFEGEINGEYPLRRWLELYHNGEFSLTSNPFENRSRAIDAGAYDWWNDKTALKWVERLGKKIEQICKSDKVDLDKMYVFYKQICPCDGPLYDSFRICDIESGRVLFCIDNLKDGCHGDSFSGWEVYQFSNDEENRNIANFKGNWKSVKEFFGIVK